MLARVESFLLQGIDALPCEVEVDIVETKPTGDMGPATTTVTVGLPDSAVKESNQRVRAALHNSGFFPPLGRTLINLAPADVRKEGPLYDLPIAVATLIAQGVIQVAAPAAGALSATKSAGFAPTESIARGLTPEAPSAREYLLAGELALDGRLRPVRGVIAMAALARARGRRGVIVPADNASEASVVPGIEAIGVRTLAEVVGLLNGHLEPQPHPPMDVEHALAAAAAPVDFVDVRGQEAVKRAIIVAAAGLHNLLMLGPAGTGKTMMARALPGVLPPLTPDEALEVTRIYSAAGHLPPGQGLITVRPVRTPHHTASSAAIVGGGAVPRPGEISMAHHGILFLDELPEFPRDVLETLRQPLEDHVVTIARAHGAVRFPASFMLVAAMNPTPKGDMPTDQFSKRAMDQYLSRLSGPLIDRIDIHVEAPAVPFKQLAAAPIGTSSTAMRAQILAARARQQSRSGQCAGGRLVPNSRLSGKMLDALAPMTDAARTVLGQAISELGLSARAYDKLRRIARTIADLDGDFEVIQPNHITEAVGYRLLDRKV